MQKLFNFLKYSNRCFFYIIRQYGAEVDPGVVEVQRHYAKSSFRRYFEEHGLTDIVKQAPADYLKSYSKVEYFTVVDPKLARKISHAICSRMNDGIVIESDPGFGFLSQFLVSEYPHLCLCERNEAFRSKLVNLMEKTDVQLFNFNVHNLLKMIFYVQKTPIPKVTEFYQHVRTKVISNDLPRINWILSLSSLSSVRKLNSIYLCDYSFQSLGRMEFYITLPSTLYKSITASPKEFVQRSAHIVAMFKIIFDYEVLLEDIPRKKFLPWSRSKNDLDVKLILIRIVPKENILNTFSTTQSAQSFMKFLQIGLRKKRRVIPLLESYVNNCGPIFIMDHALTVYTEFLELTPEKLLSIFFTFHKLPEFSHSTFIEEELEEYSDELEINEENLENEDANQKSIGEDDCDEEKLHDSHLMEDLVNENVQNRDSNEFV